MKFLYDIIQDLKYTRDGDTDEDFYGTTAVFGENLQQLIDDLQAVYDAKKEESQTIAALEKANAATLKELNEIKSQLAEAFKKGGEVKTSQGKRFTYPGEIVLFTSSGGKDSPAMVVEVCGFPVGKVGLRLFGRVPTEDKFAYAYYREEGELRTWMDAWRFLD